MVTTSRFDVLIIGGGLAGLSLACALRGSRLRVALLEQRAPQPAAGWDARIYAVSPANAAFLGECGAWGHLDRARVQAIERMAVMGDAGGCLDFSAYECGMDALAWTVESGRLASELWSTAKRQSNIEVLCPASPSCLMVSERGVNVRLGDGREIEAALVVGADGVQSWVREQLEIGAALRPYGEMGVVANFECERPHLGTALQWFRPDGVLAYLPLPGNRISIVWSTPEAHAAELLALAPDAFCGRVAAAGERRLGALSLLTAPAAFPLRLMRVDEVVRPRVALIGDAAHAIHPLSGHGINLGFQDACALSRELLRLPGFRDCGDVAILRRYARARAEETLLVRGLTDGLHQLFRPQFAPLVWLRNVGISLTGHMPGLRSLLVRYAAGLS